MTLLGLKLWLSLQEGDKIDFLGRELLAPGVVGGLLILYLRWGGLGGTPPSEGGMVEACGASDMESHAGEALDLVLRADGDGFGLLSFWLWLKWRGSCSTGYTETRGVVLFRRMTSGLPLEGILWNFWASQVGGLFRKLEWLCKIKNERIKGLNRNLNDDWHFRKLEVISQLGSQLRNWIFKLQNSTCVPTKCFAAMKIFTSWIVNLRNFGFEDFASWFAAVKLAFKDAKWHTCA